MTGMQKLVDQLNAHKFDTDIKLVFRRMTGPINLIDGTCVEARTRKLPDNRPLVEHVIEEIQDDLNKLKNYPSKSHPSKPLKYIYAPYLKFIVDGLKGFSTSYGCFRYGKHVSYQAVKQS